MDTKSPKKAKRGCTSKLRKEELTENELLFIEYYYDQSSPTFGNGTQSVIEAFGEEEFTDSKGFLNYNTAARRASDYLINAKFYERGAKYLHKQGFNDTSVDSQHSFLINQNADIGVKQRAIDMYNKLMGRYEKDNSQKGTAAALALSEMREMLGENEISQ
jgi:hypothetical protein